MSAESEKERQRLAEQYASMSLEQLQKIIFEPASLTDIAREALEAEINRREPLPSNSDMEETAPANPDNSPGPKLVIVRRFRDLPEALLAQGSLDSSGIESFLADDNLVRMDWFWSDSVGGIKLLVSPEVADEAIAILDQPIPESFEVSEIGEYNQPHCPQCGSLDVSFEELNKPIAYGSAYMNLPLPVHNRGWNCHACGHRWDGPAEEVTAT